jgi:GTP-binding protein EngB required for normal cell division
MISELALPDLLSLAVSSVAAPSASQAKLLEQLNYLRERLATERFQLAVLGQFKRGKSTLLNALLRADVLPTGVVPVTAIATFLQAAKTPLLRVTYPAGNVEEFETGEVDVLRERLRALVTEDGNPKNILGLERVDVFLPSQLLERGVVLIDTPGVGSTFRHNTAAADAILHECDATLFIVSPDPPITAVEIEFLARIRKTVAHLIVVLNKIDIVEEGEAKNVTAFLRRVLIEEANLDPATPLFCLSARNAFRVRQNGDAEALDASGFSELESYLLQFLGNEKRATLNAAVARKASTLLAELQLETDIVLRAFHLPLEDLEKRMTSFDEAAKEFETERRAAADLLAGDRLRALQELEATAERLRTEGQAALAREVDQMLAEGKSADDIRQSITNVVIGFFDAALKDVVRDVADRINGMFSVHQRRADDLINIVRKTAADLLDIPFRAPESSEAFEAKRDPFWVTTGRTVELSPIPPGALDRFLPPSLRRRRLRRRLLEEINSVLTRNIENLRWATRQNLEDAFRKFGAELDERLAMSLAATRGAMKAALERRTQHSEAVEGEIAEKQAASSELAEISDALAKMSN